MMTAKQEWLVRTADREIEGPFSMEELVDAYTANRIKVCDSIALSGEKWISAQSLDCARFRASPRTEEPVPVPSPVVVARPKNSLEPMLWHLLATTFVVTILLFFPKGFRSAASLSQNIAKADAQAAQQLSSLLRGRHFKEALHLLNAREASIARSSSLQLIYAALSLHEKENLGKVAEIILGLKHSEELQFWKGFQLMRQGDFAGASVELLSLLPKHSNNVPLHYNLAWTYLELGELGRAQLYFDRAWELDSVNLEGSALQRRLEGGRAPSTGNSSLPLEFFNP